MTRADLNGVKSEYGKTEFLGKSGYGNQHNRRQSWLLVVMDGISFHCHRESERNDEADVFQMFYIW